MHFVVALFLALTTVFQGNAVRVEPSSGIAGHFGTLTVTYEVGAGGLRPGSAVRVQLPAQPVASGPFSTRHLLRSTVACHRCLSYLRLLSRSRRI